MIQVRRGTAEDIDALVDMGGRFFAFSAFSGFIPYDADAVGASLSAIVDQGALFVATCDEQLIGGIVGMLSPVWFNQNARTATELAWWVDEEYRHTSAGIKLYRAFEQWATEQGADAIVMSDLVIRDAAPAENLFKKLGFTTVERSHIKKVT
jgi:GNAT superfamily N-acetyltransferase